MLTIVERVSATLLWNAVILVQVENVIIVFRVLVSFLQNVPGICRRVFAAVVGMHLAGGQRHVRDGARLPFQREDMVAPFRLLEFGQRNLDFGEELAVPDAAAKMRAPGRHVTPRVLLGGDKLTTLFFDRDEEAELPVGPGRS